VVVPVEVFQIYGANHFHCNWTTSRSRMCATCYKKVAGATAPEVDNGFGSNDMNTYDDGKVETFVPAALKNVQIEHASTLNLLQH